MLIGSLRWLRGQHPGALLAGVYPMLFMVAMQAGPGRVAGLCLLGAMLLAVIAWSATLRRARAIAHMATARIGSAAQGYVELQGRASVAASNLIISPVSQLQCIWYRYQVYERTTLDRKWRPVDHGCSSATFEITDATGACRVDPDHAEIVGADVRTTYDGDSKTVEELLHGGCTLYVLGELSTLGGASTALSARDDISDTLTQWKSKPAELQRRFDLDRNGEIDLQEWALARRLATQAVQQQHRDIRAQPGIRMVRAPANGRAFLISALDPQRLRKRYLWWSALHLAIALGAVVGFVKWS